MILIKNLTIEVEKEGNVYRAYAHSEGENVSICKSTRINGAVSGLFANLKDVANEKTHECPRCQGKGWTTEHNMAPDAHSGDGQCLGGCPVQVGCEQCSGTGKVNNLPD